MAAGDLMKVDEDKNDKNDDDDDDQGEEGPQIRVSFVLDEESCAKPPRTDKDDDDDDDDDRGGRSPSLAVPTDPVAVPSSVRRRDLSAVINHLLGRRVTRDCRRNKDRDNEDDDEDDEDDEDDDDDDDDRDKLPSIPFDFLVNGRLLRTGIESAARKEGLSLERAVVVKYFPATTAPEERGGGGPEEPFPDWVTALSWCRGESNVGAAAAASGMGSGVSGWLCSGGADGSIRVFLERLSSNKRDGAGNGMMAGLDGLCAASAHTGPVKCVSTLVDTCRHSGGKAGVHSEFSLLIASGSLDQTLLTHRVIGASAAASAAAADAAAPIDSNDDDDEEEEEEERKEKRAMTQTLVPHASYVGGHFASVGSASLLRLAPSGGNDEGIGESGVVLASGDWDGGVCLWDVPSHLPVVVDDDDHSHDINDDHEDDSEPRRKKKQKRRNIVGSSKTATQSSSSSRGRPKLKKVRPKISIKAHASNVSGIAFDCASSSSLSHGSPFPRRILTGSWDHSVKVWDVSRQNCLLTLNGSRVVTSLGRCHDSDVLATSHPDCTVRLWDVRIGGKGVGAISDGSLKPSHKSWVSAVQWSPTNPYVLATTSHDGTLKLWDIRSSLPLHTVRAHAKGEKGLCLAFGDTSIYTGGSDRRIKRFVC